MGTISPYIRTHFVLLLLLPLFSAASPAAEDDLLIRTTHGDVRGKLLSVLGVDVRAFLGIPYGKPPVGELRFRAPEPADGWQGVKKATEYPNSCYQTPESANPGFSGADRWAANTPQSEDCLYLNVWSPRLDCARPRGSTPAPVLVWIYGGGFIEGTSSLDMYDGRYLSRSEGAVVVSMNYRLGPLGFLSLPDNENIRGNAGLLDQRLALQWVADNIDAFGGDPSMVTLFGESAGAASVGFHLLSPGSGALFHRAVMESGSPTAAWASVSKSEAWHSSKRLAALLGCPTSDPALLEACLRRADARKLTMGQFAVPEKPTLLPNPFRPVVDGVFLPDDVEVLLNSGELPQKELLIGVNDDEGAEFVAVQSPGFNASGESLITRKDFLAGVALAMSDADDVARDAAVYLYTDWTDEHDGRKSRDSLISLFGDRHLVCPTLEFARRYSQNGGKTFLYHFDHRSSRNPWPAWMGVMHGYEIGFVFGLPLDSSLGYTECEVEMSKRLMKHWVNFARTGNPSIDGAKWPEFTAESQEYFTLNGRDPVRKRLFRAKECRFWNTLIPRIQKLSEDLRSCAAGATPGRS